MNNFFIIAGPCILEDELIAIEIATKVKSICEEFGFKYIFKASYKKANRSKIDSFKGIGDIKALEIISKIGKSLNIETITDIHEAYEAEIAAKYVDHLQIPAFLCRQTELLEAAAKTGKTVNIKKGQFLSPESMIFAVEKVKSFSNSNIWLTERGNSFGYNDLIVDSTAISRLKKHNVPVIMDCTHSVQKPNQLEGVTGGSPELIESITLAAVVNKVDGLFFETHPNPSIAKSDSSTMLKLSELKPLLRKVKLILDSNIHEI